MNKGLKNAAKATVIMMIMTLISKSLGFINTALRASAFGIGMESASYVMARTIPLTIFTVISMALAMVFIPIYTDLTVNESHDKANKFANNIINVVAIIGIGIVLIGIVFSPFIMKIFSGYKGEQLDLTINLTKIMFSMVLFILCSYLFSALLQANKHFSTPAVAPIIFNLTLIIYFVFFQKKYGIYGLAYATIIAALFQALIQIPVLKKYKYNHKFKVDFKDEYVSKIVILALPVMIGSGMQELAVIIDRSMAARLAGGSVAALDYANVVNTFAIGVFGASIVLVIFPYLSKYAVENNIEKMKETLKYAINLTLLIMVPVAVGIIILRIPVVKILFERKAFTSEATEMTSSCLLFYAMGLPFIIIRDLFSRIFYSMKKVKIPMYNGIIGLGINVLLIVILIKPLGYKGLALSTALTYFITMITLGRKINKQLGIINWNDNIVTFIKVITASLAMGVGVYSLNNLLVNYLNSSIVEQIILLCIDIISGVIIYFILCYLLKIDELKQLINIIKQKVRL